MSWTVMQTDILSYADIVKERMEQSHELTVPFESSESMEQTFISTQKQISQCESTIKFLSAEVSELWTKLSEMEEKVARRPQPLPPADQEVYETLKAEFQTVRTARKFIAALKQSITALNARRVEIELSKIYLPVEQESVEQAKRDKLEPENKYSSPPHSTFSSPQPAGGLSKHESAPSPPVTKRGLAAQLEKVEIPKFNGDKTEFSVFWTMFDSLVHSDTDLSKIEKFIYLRMAMTDKAKIFVESFDFSAANYDVVVNELKKRYNKSGLKRAEILASLDALPSVQTSSDCSDLLDQIRVLINRLESTKLKILDSIQPSLISTIRRKFPKAILAEVFKTTRSHPDATVREILDVFQTEIDSAMEIDAELATVYGQQLASEDENASQQDQSATEPTGQWTNTSAHLSNGGETTQPYYQQIAVPQPQQAVYYQPQQQAAYFQQLPSFGTSQRPSVTPPSCPASMTYQKGQQQANVGLFEAEAKPQQIVLKTITGFVQTADPRKFEPLTFFFDDGANLSMITDSAVIKLNLQAESQGQIVLSGIGGVPRTINTQTYRLNVKTVYGTTVQVSVRSMNTLTSPFSTAILNSADKTYLQTNNIAGVNMSGNGDLIQPDIIIGKDLYHQFVNITEDDQLPSGLTIARTVLGAMIHGVGSLDPPLNGNDNVAHANTAIAASHHFIQQSKDPPLKNYKSMNISAHQSAISDPKMAIVKISQLKITPDHPNLFRTRPEPSHHLPISFPVAPTRRNRGRLKMPHPHEKFPDFQGYDKRENSGQMSKSTAPSRGKWSREGQSQIQHPQKGAATFPPIPISPSGQITIPPIHF